jgi:hypothetical protein
MDQRRLKNNESKVLWYGVCVNIVVRLKDEQLLAPAAAATATSNVSALLYNKLCCDECGERWREMHLMQLEWKIENKFFVHACIWECHCFAVWNIYTRFWVRASVRIVLTWNWL